MLEPIQSDDATGRRVPGQAFLCLHGHFYQPPRENPFTNQIPPEPAATPFANFNEKITVEYYAPNAEAGNFDALNFDLGPTLAAWLEKAHPEVLKRIVEADHRHVARYGVGNAMAQAYNHTILPLATTRDKQTQITWGLSDFRHRYGREATGMWLAETAVDLETLDILAQHGITYTVLAPWQAASPIDPSEPYRVRLFGGRSITVFFYNAPLSGGVSFDWNTTSNADLFAANYLPGQLQESKREAGQPQLILIATDGELYGHHRPWRDKFLSHLINFGAPAYGFEVCTLERYMRMFPATREAELRLPSAWSCSHGIARWDAGCECTEGERCTISLRTWTNCLKHLPPERCSIPGPPAMPTCPSIMAGRRLRASGRVSAEKIVPPTRLSAPCNCSRLSTTSSTALRVAASSSRISIVLSRAITSLSPAAPSASTGRRWASISSGTSCAISLPQKAGALLSPAPISTGNCR